MPEVKNIIPKAVQHLKEWRVFKTTTDNKSLFMYNPGTGIFESGIESIVEARIQEHVKEETRTYLVKEVIEMLKRETLIGRKEFESYVDWVNVKNGMLNLKTNELVSHDPKFLSLKQIPVTYIPDANCPRFKKFLHEVVSEDDGKDIMRFWGFTLASHCKFEKAIVLVGEGENGKSVMLYIVTEFFGRDNASSESLHSLCESPFRKAELFGKVANIKSELTATKIAQVEDFKSLVSGIDTITGERKHQHPFRFLNTAKLWFSCNELPIVSFDDKAYFRRWIVIPFPHTFVKGVNADVNLVDALTTEEEKSGILNLALEGYKELERDGGFINWNDAGKLKQKYMGYTGDSVARFIIEKLGLEGNGVIPKDVLYAEYEKYCEAGSHPRKAYDAFYRAMESMIGISKREFYPTDKNTGKQVHSLRGISIKS